MTLSIYIVIALLIVTAEIIYDKWCWRQDPWKNDKPISTILRYGAGALACIIIYLVTLDINLTLRALAVIVGTFFLTFDFTLNVSRWKDLPMPHYQPFWSRVKRYIDSGYSSIQAAKMAYSALTTWENIVYKVMIFTSRCFYHGGDKKKWSYDWIWNRIPPQGELLIKGIVFYMAVYYYFT